MGPTVAWPSRLICDVDRPMILSTIVDMPYLKAVTAPAASCVKIETDTVDAEFNALPTDLVRLAVTVEFTDKVLVMDFTMDTTGELVTLIVLAIPLAIEEVVLEITLMFLPTIRVREPCAVTSTLKAFRTDLNKDV